MGFEKDRSANLAMHVVCAVRRLWPDLLHLPASGARFRRDWCLGRPRRRFRGEPIEMPLMAYLEPNGEHQPAGSKVLRQALAGCKKERPCGRMGACNRAVHCTTTRR